MYGPGETDIAVEIFDMKASRDAFGVFTNMREKNQHESGQGSQEVEGSLIFWKDHYFVSLSTNKSSERRFESKPDQSVQHIRPGFQPKTCNCVGLINNDPDLLTSVTFVKVAFQAHNLTCCCPESMFLRLQRFKIIELIFELLINRLLIFCSKLVFYKINSFFLKLKGFAGL